MSIIKIIMRIYRTHDHDLMLLQYGNVISLGRAIKKAVIAYYRGEEIRFSTEAPDWKEPAYMPLIFTIIFELSDADAPGITEWARGIKPGYRNCFFKNIFRHCLDDPGVSMFRSDGWRPKMNGNGAAGVRDAAAIAEEETKRKRNAEQRKPRNGAGTAEKDAAGTASGGKGKSGPADAVRMDTYGSGGSRHPAEAASGETGANGPAPDGTGQPAPAYDPDAERTGEQPETAAGTAPGHAGQPDRGNAQDGSPGTGPATAANAIPDPEEPLPEDDGADFDAYEELLKMQGR